MTWFKNLKIRTKLLISFLFVAFIVGTIGITGITSLQELSGNDARLYEEETVPIGIMGNIASSFNRQRVDILESIVSPNPQRRADQKKKALARDAEIDAWIPKYEKFVYDKQDKELFAEFSTNYAAYESSRENIFALTEQNKIEEVLKYHETDFDTVRYKVQGSMEKLMQYTLNSAKERSEENAANSNASVKEMMIMVIFGILLALGTGRFLADYLSKNLNQVFERMGSLSGTCITNLAKESEQLANGNLNIKIVSATELLEIHSQDEIGQLSENMNKVITNTKGTIASVEKAVKAVKEMVDEINLIVDASINGKLKTRGNSEKFSGSYKELIEGLNRTLEAFTAPIDEQSKVLEKMSGGDLTVRMEGEYKGDFQTIKLSINTLAGSFGRALSEVSSAIGAAASSSSQISSSAEEMAAGAQEQSSQTREIAGAIEEMAHTISQTTKNASTASNNAKSASEIAKEGGNVIKATIEGMNRISEVVKSAAFTVQELGEGSEQIGTIVQVIDDIADQTNLLALNAAIEAARAGEQGRGFAVVADEVRKLAERTTKATKEIALMVKKIQTDTTGAVDSMKAGTKEVEKGKELARKAEESLNRIINGALETVDIVNQVAAASEQQSTTAEQISKSIDGINNVTQESAAGIQQIARAAEDLNNLTVNLQNLIAQFKIDESGSHFKTIQRGNGHNLLALRSSSYKI